MVESVSCGLRLPAELHARIAAEAERRDVSFNRLIHWAIERRLPEWETQNLLEPCNNPTRKRATK